MLAVANLNLLNQLILICLPRMPVLEKIDKEFSWSSKLHICKYWKFVQALFRTKYMLLIFLGLKWSAFPHNEIVVFVIGVVQTVPKSVRFMNRNHLFVRGVTALEALLACL